MKMSEFKYNLPEEKIAKFPPKERGTTKLLVVDRKSGDLLHRNYSEVLEYLREGDVIVLNETKVEKRRTFFQTEKGRELEVLFLNHTEGGSWYCLVKGGRYVRKGDILKSGDVEVEIVDRSDGGFLVKPLNTKAETIFESIGHTPIPPYMKRKDNPDDYIRYNTVFARLEGSVAAPTASLNLTGEILANIQKKGVKIAKIELEVGWGTFAPVREEEIEEHKIHSERISVSKDTVELVNEAKKNGKNIWAFGTTVARTLESVADDGGFIHEFEGRTELYIYPGYNWKCVDHLITNFHMPDSSLILLVSSFAGTGLTKKAYDEALKMDYKFLSYGDSMLII
ncbi:MAG TPA: tRNA preQ1(34) S-adenosylmethionine ribosyltransferase-isomerase QueA [Candidatus Dojkabacteria bacterium]|nr:tRNA preQ1(34) S-adenosylmethionine ribosyltransferase-isomerase QueA [Candidatus Dojkabacteria bacterium]HQI92632.1 tRNA preQ1(34) S-adenosylmethionine ribosyltransferase-isomerase QueA [Candidatus Dojkabacteria bacterium]